MCLVKLHVPVKAVTFQSLSWASQNFNFRLNKLKFEILNLEFQFISKRQEHGWMGTTNRLGRNLKFQDL